MADYINHLLFGIYPYICMTVFLLGCLVRFEREQYTWKSDSSQLLKQGNLRIGSNLFHIGIISLLFTHAVGLLTPKEIYHAFGLTVELKQLMAIIGGAVLGLTCFAGLILLIHRRLTEPRIYATNKFSDWLTLIWILITLSLGLISILVSLGHRDGHEMVQLAMWAQHLVTLQSDAASFVLDVPMIYKLHMMMGMTLFFLFPFTRLVHAWSGFGALDYLFRAWQLVRPRKA